MPGSFSGNEGEAAAAASDGGPAHLDGGAQDGGSAGTDRCDVGLLDPSNPPRALSLRGDLGAHDPVIIAAEGLYRYFSTGNGISVKTSPDLLQWTQQGDVFPTTPAWFRERVPAYAPRNIWAPDISYFGGQYHLYYSVSSFGSNRSCIGHATRPALEAGEWLDREAVFCSGQEGQNDDYNAIDPNVVLDAAGTPWMAFGSFWSGVKMIRLGADGARAGDDLVDLASRGGGAIEAPFIVRRCGYYYLFVSFDACCQGADSTYNTRVGRSPDLFGPYVDRAGTPMLSGGGSLVLGAAGDWVGPGHNAILIDGARAYNVYHAYAAGNGVSQLRIAELVWDGEGWPISGGP
jgi:arabinan endo-1,5-alpha-L-arabinosidase